MRLETKYSAVLSIVAGAILLAGLYLPTLTARFDFIDDGNLVYPAPQPTAAERLHRFWDRVVSNFHHLGPFRPVVWAHWEIAADLYGGDPVRWRLARLVWNGLSAGLLLWLLRELGARPRAALFAAALAMGSAYRSEIWTSLTLSEGVAMPYALLTLLCAVRAARSSRPWKWDLAGLLCLLAALGCKNTFAALAPAVVVLRLLAGGLSLRDGWRCHGTRALLPLSALLLPAAHYLVFRLTWHPGQYTPGELTWGQMQRMLGVVAGALNVSFAGPGLLLAILAVYFSRRGDWTERWRAHRVPLLAGAILLLVGVGVYVPLDGVSARYSMPGIWGMDIAVALLLTRLADVPAGAWKRTAQVALALGLAAVLVANLGRQERVAARAEVLWEALEEIEREAPAGACVAWHAGPALNVEEGIHFAWHLHHRGRGDVGVRLLESDGQVWGRPELPVPVAVPSFRITGSPEAPEGWQAGGAFAVPYWFGLRSSRCYLFRPQP